MLLEPELISIFTVRKKKKLYPGFSFPTPAPNSELRYKPNLDVIDHTDTSLLSRYLCTAIYKITSRVIL